MFRGGWWYVCVWIHGDGEAWHLQVLEIVCTCFFLLISSYCLIINEDLICILCITFARWAGIQLGMNRENNLL
jgi:hypothetical protein